MREVLITEDEISDFEEGIESAENAKDLYEKAKVFIGTLRDGLTTYKLL